MNLDFASGHLRPVAGSVSAGIITYDRDNPDHRRLLREGIPHFLGSLGAEHGEAYPQEHLEAVLEVINAKEIEVDFFFVKLDQHAPIKFAGLATGAPTFGVEPDTNNNLRIFPIKHGEDLVVDQAVAQSFREQTKCDLYPNGVGAGSFFMAEQIRRSINPRRPDGKQRWVYAGRDNEYMAENMPIIRVMDKYGAIRGTERNSPVLELNGLTPDMERRWGVNVVTEDFPKHTNGQGSDANNFLTRWSSKDGEQQIVVIFTKLASTFDGRPVVWTKVKSNGDLPQGEMLKEVMASLLRAGCMEMSSPERKWGLARKFWSNDVSDIFHGPVPQMHIHTNMEPEVVDALLKMGADYRKFGHHTMLSGIIRLQNMTDPETIIGQKIPAATEVHAINQKSEVNGPYFSVVDEIQEDVKRMFAAEKTVTKSHNKALTSLRESVRLVFARKATGELTPH